MPVTPKSDVPTTLEQIAAMNEHRDPSMADPEPVSEPTEPKISYSIGTEPLPAVVQAVLTHKLLGDAQPVASTTMAQPSTIDLPRSRPATPSATTTTSTGIASSSSKSLASGGGLAPAIKVAPKKDSFDAKKRRFVLRSKIKKYLKYYESEVREFVPVNWNNLSDAALEEVVQDCDYATTVGNEGEFIAAAVVGTARAFEGMKPFLPAPYCYSHGCSDQIYDQLRVKDTGETRVDTMLGSAVNKLGILYTGSLPVGNPWVSLAFALATSLHKHCKENEQLIIQNGHLQPNEPVEALGDLPDQYADL